MSQRTAIGWTEATWNPVTGCSHVSPGCEHCYAEALELRFGRSTKPWTAQNAAENVKLHPERLEQPLRWRTPRRVFVNSMSDLFHERVTETFLDQVFAIMAVSPRHTFQVLTKRPERMRDYVSTDGRAGAVAAETGSGCDDDGRDWPFIRPDDLAEMWPLPNVWLGVSCEDQRRADERLPLLLETPAAVRFVSLEPLLGPIDFPLPCDGSVFWGGLHWGIIGGESGPQYRPMQVEWAQGIADTFAWAHVPLYVKQDSGPRPGKQGRLSDALWARKEYPA
jgi:protein gp37